jgi:tripeptidyl-peptidase-1
LDLCVILLHQWFDPAWVSSDVQVIGPNDQSNPGGEATMDVQLIMGVASNVSAVFWSTAGSQPHGPNANEPFLTFLSDMLSLSDPPLVVTTSYGDDELDLDIDYLNKVNQQFQIAGVRGISLLFASGDGGVAGGHGIANCTTFVAVFPSASPFVTAVGGTQLNDSTLEESGIDFSSGGFSNYWAQPTYQQEAVKYYLNTGVPMPGANLFNASGRAFVSQEKNQY